MKCPRCESIVLEEHARDGVVIDGCRECRGIWLDRGELEKLIARAVRDDDRRGDGDRFDDDDDDDDRRIGRGGRRRGGFFDSLGDLFD